MSGVARDSRRFLGSRAGYGHGRMASGPLSRRGSRRIGVARPPRRAL